MKPLDGPRLKVRRAESQIQALDDAMFAMWKDTPFHVVRAERNPKTGNDIYRVQTSVSPFFLDWGVTVGEIGHNLRSALDGLVYQLALRNTKTPTRDTSQQFPILLVRRSKRPSSDHLRPQFEFPRNAKGNLVKRRGDGRSMIRSLSPEHQALIERLQPYKRGRGGHKNPLYRLKEINNADKHRLITPIAALWGAGPSESGPPEGALGEEDFSFRFRPYRGRFHGRILENGARLGEAPPDVEVDSDIHPLISFGEEVRVVAGLPVPETLRGIAEHVSEIVESFGPEFS